MHWIDFVSRSVAKRAVKTKEGEVVSNNKSPEIEQDMMVRTQAEEIAHRIRSVMWRSQSSDMRPLSVWACTTNQPNSADLAMVVV
jgi:hypothetical protein